jgi:hypothetical protein
LVSHEGQALLAAAGNGCDFIFGSSEREFHLMQLLLLRADLAASLPKLEVHPHGNID